MTFKQFACKFFDGNEEKAIEQLAYEGYNKNYVLTGNGRQLQDIIDELDEAQAELYMEYFGNAIEENPELFDNLLDEAIEFGSMGMDVEEFNNAQKNPFAKKAIIYLVILLAGIPVFLGLIFLKKTLLINSVTYDNIVKLGAGVFVSWLSFKLISNIYKAFKFRKFKKKRPVIQAWDENADLTNDDNVEERTTNY